MAADEVLLETAARGIASLRFYGWPCATITLGYFQVAAESRAYPGLADLPMVRRASGGATLVHDREITYAIGIPAGPPWQSRGDSWLTRMHSIIAAALAACGVEVRPCGPGEEKKLGDVLCFLHQTPGDLLLGSHKVVGSAQRKQRGGLMQHGGILLSTSLHIPMLPGIRDLSGQPVPSADLALASVDQFGRQLGAVMEEADWSAAERERIATLAAERYSQAAWNYKR
jgi:lipoate-protein ligase A